MATTWYIVYTSTDVIYHWYNWTKRQNRRRKFHYDVTMMKQVSLDSQNVHILEYAVAYTLFLDYVAST